MSDSNSTAVPKKAIRWIVGGIIALIVVIVGVSLFGTWQGVINDGNRKEALLSAQYANGANVLSACVVKTKQAANVAVTQSDKLNEIIAKAVAGRYDNGGASVDDGKLFSAITESYPDLSGLDKTFQLVIATINGCRDDYAHQQTRVLDAVHDFKAWHTDSFWVRTFGGDFPNENLYIKLPNVSIEGQSALDKMSAPIVDTTTELVYQKGTFDLTDPFEEDNGK